MKSVLVVVVFLLCLTQAASAQRYWRPLPSGYWAWGAYREWPRRFYSFTPGYRYYGPGTFIPFSYWHRNPRYLY